MSEILQHFKIDANFNIFKIFKDVNLRKIHRLVKSVQANRLDLQPNRLSITGLCKITILQNTKEFTLHFTNGIQLLFNCYEKKNQVITFFFDVYQSLNRFKEDHCMDIHFVKWSQIQNQKKLRYMSKNKLSLNQLKKMMQDKNQYLERNFKNFQILKKLGKGQYGQVYLIFNKISQELQALKVPNQSKESFQQSLKEINILKNLKSKFTVELKDSFIHKDSTFMLLDYHKQRDLFDYFKNKFVTELQAKFIIANIIIALDDLLSIGYIHRDIKLENLLVGEDGYINLCDFGLSTSIDDKKSLLEACGTPEYMAPEIILGQQATILSDFWSLGILLYRLLTQIFPFVNSSYKSLFKAILFKTINFELISKNSKNCQNFLRFLLKRSPKNRLGCQHGIIEIQNHFWFNDIDWNLLKSKAYISPLIRDGYSYEDNDTKLIQRSQCKNEKIKTSFNSKHSTNSSIETTEELFNKTNQIIQIHMNKK